MSLNAARPLLANLADMLWDMCSQVRIGGRCALCELCGAACGIGSAEGG
jgi:hypothetical protein